MTKYSIVKLFLIGGFTFLLSHIPLSYTVIATTYQQPGTGKEASYPSDYPFESQLFINANNGYEIMTCFAHAASNATQNDLLSQAITHMCDFQLLYYLGNCQKTNNAWMYCHAPDLQKYNRGTEILLDILYHNWGIVLYIHRYANI